MAERSDPEATAADSCHESSWYSSDHVLIRAANAAANVPAALVQHAHTA